MSTKQKNEREFTTMSNSEVARLKAQIVLEYESAKQGLSGLAQGTARHDFINAKTERVALAVQQLRGMVGDEEAGRILFEQEEAVAGW
jgi:hypothetical protein